MRFIVRRLAFYAVAAWAALTVNFFVPRFMPGNAVEAIMSKFPNLKPSAAKALQAMLGVGHPGSIWHQYWSYLDDVGHFNFGTDLINYPAKVSTILGQELPWTLVLVGTSTVIAFFLGTGLGILAGWRSGGWLDRALPALTFVQALPYFFLALVLIEVFALKLTVFPQGQGYAANAVVPGWNWPFISSAVGHSVLPAFSIVITSLAGWMLQMRNVMITTTGEDYVLAAQAKGLRTRRVVLTYAARNAILPQLSGFANAIGFVVGGAIVMEIVFSYPGVGLQLINAVGSNDYPMMQAIFLLITFAVLLANLFVDLVYVAVDPRARARSAR
ncbi:MAG: ABC transporter permease [Acidimicrobiales bacterium]